MERDCDVILPDGRGWLAIHYAASGNHLQCVKFLVDQRTNVNVPQLQGKTSVILVSEPGFNGVIEESFSFLFNSKTVDFLIDLIELFNNESNPHCMLDHSCLLFSCCDCVYNHWQ